MRDILIILAALILMDMSLQITKAERACRMGWIDISEYAVLSEVCNDERARAALANGDR